jgi:NhaA family Na+:H+ antiporter
MSRGSRLERRASAIADLSTRPLGGAGRAFQEFVHSEVVGSVLLIAATAVALAWANSPWGDVYQRLLHAKLGVVWEGRGAFSLTLHHWVNDGLMALFFLVVGLEIKREVFVGELSSIGKAALPVAAALGGLLAPALLYGLINRGGPGASGWGIPMATDIAFALGILALLGDRVPVALKVFLTAFAIVDDIGAVLVIAIFYTERIDGAALGAAMVLLAGLVVAARVGPSRAALSILLGAATWVAVLLSGVHATVAGILIALAVPVKARLDPGSVLEIARAKLQALAGDRLSRTSMLEDPAQLERIVELHDVAADLRPPGITLERSLHPVVAFIVLPLFALFNAGVVIPEDVWGALTSPISVGVIVGLVVGKQLGVFGVSWLAVRSAAATLASDVSRSQLYGVGALGGVGFTMSLFITELAFADERLVNQAKLGILAASLLSAVIGYLVLGRVLPRRARTGPVANS